MAEDLDIKEEGADIEVPKPVTEGQAGVTIELTKAGSAVASRQKEKNLEDGEPEGQLTIDMYQTSSEIVIESTIAGIKPEDIDIDVTNDSVTIRGARRREKEVKDEDYYFRECYWGKFSRSVILPQEVNPENADVSFKSGILSIRLPKLMRRRTKKLKIKTE